MVFASEGRCIIPASTQALLSSYPIGSQAPPRYVQGTVEVIDFLISSSVVTGTDYPEVIFTNLEKETWCAKVFERAESESIHDIEHPMPGSQIIKVFLKVILFTGTVGVAYFIAHRRRNSQRNRRHSTSD